MGMHGSKFKWKDKRENLLTKNSKSENFKTKWIINSDFFK